ncbi:uncharacterized protein rab11fip5a isoform X2 [Melanotaenia boesemani]|uniref:uncharacterized protein rab11fip5a isoform X2 n=1 Tax=Melanotaenia boesemani TaxID=1250792 RepID=UPI001C03AC5C|nr:uncharacterized protein rab11fip5a isoform X2 [Melanotaenia boesemani]
MSSLTVEEEQKWVPTHVLVTVLRGRGLRGKGKHGTSDVYTIIQLGKEKYSTGVVEKTTEPEWKEECSFELQPGVLENGGRSGYPAGSKELILTVMHRALIGQDAFLGQAVIQLDKVFHESRCLKNEWYRLHSKTGKKEKERGDIQVTIQFTRNNLTASMYDLVMKDKGSSTFSKLKERIKGKRRSSDDDSSSAVLPGGYGSLYRLRQRLPSDGGGEEDYEDDEGGEARRSKMRTFFFRGKLRKSSDTRSSTSLGSESSESSSRGGSLSPTAGISVVVSDLSNSPSNSSNLTVDSPDHTANTSPKSSSLKCEFGDETGEISIAVPQHTVCVNGSHAYNVQPLDPGSGKPAGSLGLGPLQKSLPLSVSLQNLSTRPDTNLQKGPVGDGRRWSFDRPGEEEKAAIAAALEKSGPMTAEEEERSEQTSLPKAASSFSASKAESEIHGKKKRNLFSHGRSESAGKSQSQSKDMSEQVSAVTEEKHKGWFGSKELHSKPSSRPPITQLFPQPSNPNSVLTHNNPTKEDSIIGADAKREMKVEKRPLPPPPTEWRKTLPKKSSNPFMSVGELKPDSEWDESFEAFAAGRLQSPEGITTECRTQRNTLSDHPLEHCNNKAALQPGIDADEHTNVYDSLHHPPGIKFISEAHEVPIQAPNAITHHFDTFPQFLETIPEQRSFENDDMTVNTLINSPTLCAFNESKQDNTTNDVTNTIMNSAPFHVSQTQLNSGSPDPTSSGLGSSAEEDGFSCFSSHSDKFSASSSEEADSSIIRLELFSESALGKNGKPSDAKGGIADRSDGQFSVDVARQTQIPQEGGDGEKVELSDSEGSLTLQTWETGSKGGDAPNVSIVHPDLLPKPSEPQSDNASRDASKEELNISTFFSKDFSGSSVNNATAVILGSPDNELSTTGTSIQIMTSSPEIKLGFSEVSLEDTGVKEQDANHDSHVPFSLFGDSLNISHIANSPNQGFDSNLLHTHIFNQSGSSSLPSLYVSTDSQEYQTCDSYQSSKHTSFSELNETLYSANSTLCGELSDIQITSCAANEETSLFGNFVEPSGVQSKMETPEESLTIGDGLQVLPAAPPSSNMVHNPKGFSEEEVEKQCGVSADMFSKYSEAQNASLQRSQSESSLAPAFDLPLLPTFGSDPGPIQESFSAQLGPEFPSLIPFTPSLTPESNSSQVAIFALPPLSNISATFPPSSAQGAEPKPAPEDTEQQQDAADPLNSPHPVKPLTTAMLSEEKRSVLVTSLEKLKSTIHPGKSSQITEQETDRKKSLTEGAGSYYHLTHSELVALLVQREADLERQKAEFERQKLLLAKREVELRKLKPQVKDLEDYIDTLLVRIMEQKPTLLQVRSKFK